MFVLFELAVDLVTEGQGLAEDKYFEALVVEEIAAEHDWSSETALVESGEARDCSHSDACEEGTW